MLVEDTRAILYFNQEKVDYKMWYRNLAQTKLRLFRDRNVLLKGTNLFA